jgi:hypothetical protein
VTLAAVLSAEPDRPLRLALPEPPLVIRTGLAPAPGTPGGATA